MSLEPLWYEASPLVYFLSGSAASMWEAGPLLMKFSGMLLAMTALTIVGLRAVWRRPARVEVRPARDRDEDPPAR